MGRIIIAVGKLAKDPYYIAKIERNIYSVEELCYTLVQSAQFLDTDIMDPALVHWIGTELALPGLAKKLSAYLGKPRSLSDFVACILNETGYVSQDRQIRTRQIVASGAGMEQFEKRYARAVIMAENGQSYQALHELQALLEDLPEPERKLHSKVLRQTGRIYAELFRFREAADAFEQAYKLTSDEDSYLQYLAAVRMSLSDAEYVAFVADHPESYNASLALEKRVQEEEAAYDQSEAKMAVDQLLRYRNQGQDTNYEIALQKVIQKMKDDYRRAKQPAL